MTSTLHRPNSFEALYIHPENGEQYTDEFEALCEINFGMSREGAQRHFETLGFVPDGYTYHGKWPKNRFAEDYADRTDIVALLCPAYDIGGVVLEDEIVLAKRQTNS